MIIKSSLCFSQSVYKTLPKTTFSIETAQAGSLLNVPQNMKISKRCDKKLRHNDVITKKMENNGTSAEPNKIYRSKSFDFDESYPKNVAFIEFEPLCQKSFMSSFTVTTHQIWSCHITLATNFENPYFLPNSILNFRNNYEIGGNWLKNKTVTGKNKTGGGTPVLIGLNYVSVNSKPDHPPG